MDITVYDTASGVIKSIFCGFSDSERASLVAEGESFIEGAYPPDIYSHVENGAAVLRQTSFDYAESNRHKRDALLFRCDWTQMNDSPLSDSDKASWRTYRQALRDLPNHTNWPNLVSGDWPSEPTGT